jgi:hypothetical protein
MLVSVCNESPFFRKHFKILVFVLSEHNTDLVFFYSILLDVSAFYFSQHQVGILVHKKSKREETSPYKQWV